MRKVVILMRLVDADSINNTIETNHCKSCNNYKDVMCRACTWMDAMDYIEDAPTIEAEREATTMREMTQSEKAELISMPIFNMICNNCGAMCFDDDTYCSECGRKFD